MLIGILSDTHGHFIAAKAGVDLLLAKGAQVLVHCGDVGGTDIVDLLARVTPSYFVFGNTDWDRDELAAYARQVGVTCLCKSGEFMLDGQRMAVLHGDDAVDKARVLQGQKHNYLLQGHTHVRQDQTVGTVRVINPGALYRASVKTVALLDAATGALTWPEVDVAIRP
jgi:putative phosphoesterase